MADVDPFHDFESHGLPTIFSPFTRLNEDFRNTLLELVTLITEHGIQTVDVPHVDGGPPVFKDAEHRNAFLGAVHEGWKHAQLRIIHELLRLDEDRTEKLASAKEAHRQKNLERKKELHADASMLAFQVNILRRFQDAIAWMILNGQHHVIRRLHQSRLQPPPSRTQLEELLPVLEQMNAEPLKIAIAADVTTFIGTFDVLLRDAGTGKTSFVEVKSGRKNIAIAKQAHFAEVANCAMFESITLEQMSPTDRKHFERVRRQLGRLRSIEEIINTDRGTDHRTGAKTHIFDPGIDISHYYEILTAILEAIGESKNWAIKHIDECLYLGAYKEPRFAMAFWIWVRSGKDPCMDRIWNLLDSFRAPLTRPLVATGLAPDKMKILLSGQVTALLCLDFNAWINASNSKFGPRMFLESPVQSRKHLEQSKSIELAQHDGCLIGVRTGEQVTYIGQGAIDRILFDFQSPLSVTEIILANADDNDRTNTSAPQEPSA